MRRDQSTYSNRMGSSEARWWNPECINTYKVATIVMQAMSTIVITDYIRNYIILRFKVQILLQAKVLKALVWRLHVRFHVVMCKNGLYLT